VKVKSTWKSTLEAILIAIDFQLRTNYYAKREAASTNGRYESSVLAATTGHFAPYIILDDLDRLRTLRGDKAEEILKGLVDLMEGAGLVIIVVGTVRVRYLLQQFPAYQSKFSSAGHFKFEPVREAKDFDRFVTALKEQSVSRTKIAYGQDFDHQLYIRTMGVRRFIREFMRIVMLRHAYEERTVPNAALLDDILDDELEYLKPCLQVLWQVAAGFDARFLKFQAYEDLVPPEKPKVPKEERVVLLKWAEEVKALTPQQVFAKMSPEVHDTLQAARRKARQQAAEAKANGPAQEKPVAASEVQPCEQAVASTAAAPKRKRGRPPGSRNKVAAVVPADDPSAIR